LLAFLQLVVENDLSPVPATTQPDPERAQGGTGQRGRRR
jgi:hypothetical protein